MFKKINETIAHRLIVVGGVIKEMQSKKKNRNIFNMIKSELNFHRKFSKIRITYRGN